MGRQWAEEWPSWQWHVCVAHCPTSSQVLKAHAASPMPVGRTRPSPALSRPQLRQGPGNPPRSFTCSQATWAVTSSCAHISASCSPQPLQTRSKNASHLARECPPRFLASGTVWATVSQRGTATLKARQRRGRPRGLLAAACLWLPVTSHREPHQDW